MSVEHGESRSIRGLCRTCREAWPCEVERLRHENDRLREALVIARHWMHMDADPEQFESFPFDRAQVDAGLSTEPGPSAGARGEGEGGG